MPKEDLINDQKSIQRCKLLAGKAGKHEINTADSQLHQLAAINSS
jgi:hypothetical protein